MNNLNYDAQFCAAKNAADRQNPAKLLLHVCCAPCATYCLTQLADAYDITLYYSNDNITDADEWNKRLGEIVKLVQIVNDGNYVVKPLRQLKLAVKPQCADEFFRRAKGLESEKEGGARCEQCFDMRLGDAFDYARANGYGLVATTLTVSPYKNSRLLNEIGLRLQTDQTKWLPTDFKKRNGYLESIQLCARYGIYRQHYCGCAFSYAQAQQQTTR